MAEDPKFLLHFKTLAKFNEKLADGTINPNRHLVFISGNDAKPEQLIWCRGRFYSDGSKFEDLVKYYNDYEITQTGASSLTITLKGRLWNASTRTWSDITKPLTVNSASASVAGLMSALDKRQLDIVSTANFQLDDPTYSTTAVTLNATHTDVNSETTGLKTSKSITAASSTKAGVMTSANYTEIYTNIPNSISNVNSTLSTSIANEVTRAKAAEKANADAIAAEIINRNTAISGAVNALDSTQTGSSTNVTVKVDQTDGKLTGVTVTLSDIASAAALSSEITRAKAAEAAAKTVVNAKTTGHVTVSSSNATDGHSVVTISENDIASAATLSSHISNKSNPHEVTKAQVGLGNVDNTSDANKPVSTATLTALNNKVDKVSGKGLSTNDYTTDEKNKLAGIAAGANNYSLPTASSTTLGGVKVGSNLSISNGVLSAIDTTYSNATQSAAGLMSSTDKTKLDGIATGANNYSLPLAASGTRGGVQIGYTANGKNYPVLLSSEKMYVNVPWEDTTYSNATTTTAGLMSAVDKTKLDGLSTTSVDDTHIVWTGLAGPALGSLATIDTHDFRFYDAHEDLGSTGYPGKYGQLLRFLSRKAISELYFLYSSWTVADNQRIMYRNKSDNDASPWTSWKQIAFVDDIPTKLSQLTNDMEFGSGSGTVSGVTEDRVNAILSDYYTSEEVDNEIYNLAAIDIPVTQGCTFDTFSEDDTRVLMRFNRNQVKYQGVIHITTKRSNSSVVHHSIPFDSAHIVAGRNYFWVPWLDDPDNYDPFWFYLDFAYQYPNVQTSGGTIICAELTVRWRYSCISNCFDLDNSDTKISVEVTGVPYREPK